MDLGFEAPSEKKAGFNQSFGITEMLINLTGSYITSISANNLISATESIQRILDLISPKLKDKEMEEADELIKKIYDKLPRAIETYIHEGRVFFMNPPLYEECKKEVIKAFRLINLLQDKHGYGMLDADDPKLAVYE